MKIPGLPLSIVVPEYPPDFVQAVADRHYFGDREKVSTTWVGMIELHGVEITSRYQKADELQTMVDVLQAAGCADKILKMHCDSKAQACYVITAKDAADKMDVAHALGHVFLWSDGGYNAIYVHGPGRDDDPVVLDPAWANDVA